MAESARKKHRFSPDAQAQDTPSNNATLQPITPFRRAISAGPTPGSRRTPLIRTPGTGRTPRGGPATRPLPSRRIAPTTPHAIRALRERANAARTPGNNRRRSGRIQRETPRDLLRDLSRALAHTSRPVEPSPQVLPQRPRHSALDLPDVEDGPPMAAPRLSMPLENMYDDDDDSFHSAPPRQSLLPDLPDDVDGGTVQSLEFGRRAISEDPRLMYGGRQSERFGDLSELEVQYDDDQDPTAALEDEDLTLDQDNLGWESDPPVDDDAELAAYREEESAIDRSLQTHSPERPSAEQLKGVRKAKEYMVSEHGIGFPSFPAAPVKKLALSFMKSQGSKAHLSKDTLDALMLPRELVQQLRMQPPVKLRSQKRKRPEPIQEEHED
ncbi:hypothetical protein GGP41_010232 [Bipolaris sorokiniana]|uniref:CENP-T/Histone H4 histone fold domain-containing protein n=1 Tax=Cochliobolus sativus TaxID=45130 RepID=A0A8H5ZM20_COCSA|nr:hypothetical protein GGP41_010232 [Bipolaris sorokiniana]